jgi:hypothetical protein
MKKALLWEIADHQPKRLPEGKLQLEKHLEDWIAADPDLIQVGLTVIARQLVVAAGRIDLLALDPAGRLVIVEVKRGTLYRDTVAQGLDYAECIATLPTAELMEKCDLHLQKTGSTLKALLTKQDALDQIDVGEREVLLYVVGTGKAERLERLAQFLEKVIPIYLVVFDVYKLEDGRQILLRELSEGDQSGLLSKEPITELSLNGLYQRADSAGIGSDFRRLCEAALSWDLHPRLFKTSVMFTPIQSKNRMIFTVWTKPLEQKLKVYLSPEAISEFYPVSVSDATQAIGPGGSRPVSGEDLTELIQKLNALFSSFQEPSEPAAP